jgi:hypothetical protein
VTIPEPEKMVCEEVKESQNAQLQTEEALFVEKSS